jgi:hypothetical protein
LDDGVIQWQMSSQTPGRDQVNPTSQIEFESSRLLVAAADEQSPPEDFVRDFVLRMGPR